MILLDNNSISMIYVINFIIYYTYLAKLHFPIINYICNKKICKKKVQGQTFYFFNFQRW